jgi:hypothetical protein
VREATACGGRLKPEPSISLRSPYTPTATPQPQPLNPNPNPTPTPTPTPTPQHQPDAAGGRGAERARTYPDLAQSAVPDA